MTEHQNDKHYNVKEMGELFSISRSTLDRLVREGKLKKTKFGSRTLFSALEVQRYLASQNTAA